MTQEQETQDTLLQRAGGRAGLETLVGALYFNLLNDSALGAFFIDAPMAQVLSHQKAFLAYLLGGDDSYGGRELGPAHAKLIQEQGLREYHFDQLLATFQRTALDLGITHEVTAELMAQLESTRRQIFPK